MGGEDTMTDLVYITGGRSAWQDNELRYSLRSMQKYLTGMGGVFIVGTCPNWLAGVTHIPAEDYPTEKKEVRLYRKIMVACRDERISEDFLLCYDDNFLLAHHVAGSFPNYYQGWLIGYLQALRGANRKGTHRRCAENTVNALGLQAKLFDVHCPMLVNRTVFPEVMSQFDWNGKRDGYLIKSTYANSIGLVVRECDDVKINHPDGTLAEYQHMIAGKPWFGTGDNMNWVALQELMDGLYPEPSVYET